MLSSGFRYIESLCKEKTLCHSLNGVNQGVGKTEKALDLGREIE